MEKETKNSDVVTITKITLPVVLIIALALIFKNEIAGLMNRGCFELSIEQAGIGIGDKSMCTGSDFEKVADSLLMAGAYVAEANAETSFLRFDSIIDDLEKRYNEAIGNLNQQIEALNKSKSANQAFHAEMIRAANAASSAETKNAIRRLTTRFNELHSGGFTPQSRMVSTSPEILSISREAIRKDFIIKSNQEIEHIQENVKVKRIER